MVDCVVVGKLIMMIEYVDVIVLCGGKSLIEWLINEVCVLMIKYFDGICYVYVDDCVDFDKVLIVCDNVKMYCYGICNMMEMLFVLSGIVVKLLLLFGKLYCDK